LSLVVRCTIEFRWIFGGLGKLILCHGRRSNEAGAYVPPTGPQPTRSVSGQVWTYRPVQTFTTDLAHRPDWYWSRSLCSQRILQENEPA